MKRALITGITGQDGSYLAELLLEKGYEVFGLARAASWSQPNCASHLAGRVNILFGDLIQDLELASVLNEAKPDEIYNLASQSRPGESWARAPETLEVNGLAAIKLFEAVRNHRPDTRVYHASSSEMFGQSRSARQDEETSFHPVNPYAAAKVYAHHMAAIYRDSYNLYITSGILFNHESERRGLHFLTQKVAYGAACAALGIVDSPDMNERGRPIVEGGRLALGNLDTARDWGYAPDFVNAMWMILQQQEPTDFVIGTGKLHTLTELCEIAYQTVGCDWKKCVFSDPALVRPLEPGQILANPAKAKELLGWSPTVSFKEMVRRMVQAQLTRLEKLL
ncbi:GDPmannose 4,6-dehydratase [Rhizobium skierniewicense]|uniref:GDP-mannose 4,6-dehydratase n=1 Tax=Rhizobium skierniewicense TaxID=984260 RepID=A0A7W6C2N1_9HYPH|nr:GDP-mannose 4,6-dehydratase [Rhizobium skierniewicense]MBB3944605.1 GDPmannose 4,6-dehydratase [Rhizobium skierniewicense]NTF33471.1 GDP-mannose 4,6-dehydratase [Rhizobium skierniewicense]